MCGQRIQREILAISLRQPDRTGFRSLWEGQTDDYSEETDFVAIGQAGFAGYIIFGFPGKNRYLLESIQPNNATYVFAENWESLSQMTKAEILKQNLHADRIIHREGWPVRVHRTLC
jgi:hypothetical protein